MRHYVMTETFKYLYADTKGFSVAVKTVWHFFDDGQNGCWMCKPETAGRPFAVRKYLFTQRILDYCLENLY